MSILGSSVWRSSYFPTPSRYSVCRIRDTRHARRLQRELCAVSRSFVLALPLASLFSGERVLHRGSNPQEEVRLKSLLKATVLLFPRSLSLSVE